jgi:hypothetical protein
MPLHDVPESDWKVFRELQPIALERFCRQILSQVQTVLLDDSRTHHERYLEMFRLLRERDEELAHAFNNPARSRMIGQLVAVQVYGLLQPDEIERFTERTRETIALLAREYTGS